MCGIAGFIHKNIGPEEAKNKITKMINIINHRGPDDIGALIGKNFCGAAARLAIEKIKYVKQGENWKQIPKKLFKKSRSNRHSSAFKRLSEKDLSVTIDTGNAHSNYFHPIFNRIPTPREAARIQSFKDSFKFIGSRTSQYRQIGNAVPPLLAKEIAVSFKKIILNK